MWRYFRTKEWLLWSWGGLALILGLTYYQVQLDVQINEWFGAFYDTLQQALAGKVSDASELYVLLYDFARIAGVLVFVAVFTSFFASHWCFRWRNSMHEYYTSHWKGSVEGASQRVQEDTLKLARILETLGIGLIEAILKIVAFLPLLHVLSKQITEVPFFGQVDNSMVWLAIITALGGTVLLAVVGGKLPGIEYDIQKEEAKYRKYLVLAEDTGTVKPKEIKDIYADVKRINYVSFFHYLYFDATKWTYLQAMVVVPYIALAPTLVSGAVTLGFVTQISRAFSKVAESFQYIVRSWSTIVELLSIHKRLREYERKIK
jgi:peptide/bleomycin uptake transporter